MSTIFLFELTDLCLKICVISIKKEK